MRLVGIELRGFRSIGEEPLVMNPLAKCNILVGQNNSGKSNVLRAVKVICDAHQGRPRGRLKPLVLTEVDLHKRDREAEFRFKLCFEPSDASDRELVGLAGTKSFWFEFAWDIEHVNPTMTDLHLGFFRNTQEADPLLQYLAQKRFAGVQTQDRIHKVFLEHGDAIYHSRFAGAVPVAHFIPEFREITAGDGEYQMNGENLIDLLARYQHPDVGPDKVQLKFERIQKFLRNLLHLSDAVLEVTVPSKSIVVKSDGLRLPVIGSYGTGVHELIILLTAVLSVDNAIVCIEEPEIHFHPRLQREFIEFLTTQTTNQYLISTHSPVFIDCMNTLADVKVFHLRLQDGATVGGPVVTDQGGLDALHDLGIKASDLLQSNCIVWVEGPSDRIYLNHWLELVRPDLNEGRHYSIMFYGGSLRTHISTERDKVPEELVNLLRINQHAIVVMDSDKTKKTDTPAEAVQRIQKECESSGSICWITDGREIENYIPAKAVASACEELDRSGVEFKNITYGKFERRLTRALKAAGVRSFNYANDKVRYAAVFARHCQLDDLGSDLRARLDEVVDAIERWNS